MDLIFPFFTGGPPMLLAECRLKSTGHKRAPEQNKLPTINFLKIRIWARKACKTLQRVQQCTQQAGTPRRPCAARRGNLRADFFELPVSSSLAVRFKLATFSDDFHAAAFLLATMTDNPSSPGALAWPPALPQNTRTRTHARGRTQDGAAFVMGRSHPPAAPFLASPCIYPACRARQRRQLDSHCAPRLELTISRQCVPGRTLECQARSADCAPVKRCVLIAQRWCRGPRCLGRAIRMLRRPLCFDGQRVRGQRLGVPGPSAGLAAGDANLLILLSAQSLLAWFANLSLFALPCFATTAAGSGGGGPARGWSARRAR